MAPPVATEALVSVQAMRLGEGLASDDSPYQGVRGVGDKRCQENQAAGQRQQVLRSTQQGINAVAGEFRQCLFGGLRQNGILVIPPAISLPNSAVRSEQKFDGLRLHLLEPNAEIHG